MASETEAGSVVERLRAELDEQRTMGEPISSHVVSEAADLVQSQAAALAEANEKIANYEEVLADKRRLAREIDVALHGEEGAANQPSLCDLIEPARKMREKADQFERERDSAVALFNAQIEGHRLSARDATKNLIRATTAEARAERLEKALRLYADACDATETHPCGYEGNMCCMTARAALKQAPE